jgi:hypothetical protein
MKTLLLSILATILLLSACHNDTIQDQPISIDHDIELSVQPQEAEYRKPPSCPVGMILISDEHHTFCIDQYEFPNQLGVNPPIALSAYDAEALVKQVGKRLCTYEEWHRACVGKHNWRYSYGSVYQAGRCNDNKTGWVNPHWELMFSPQWHDWTMHLYKGEPDGSRPNCVSDEGVEEMIGNVREWVRDPKGMGGYSIPSGYWYGTTAGAPTCDYVIRNHSPSFRSYEFGARACMNAE